MKISIAQFRGEAPRISPRLLPEGMAQQAINCRLLSGDLEAWKNFATELALSKAAPINTIYKLGDYWLEWTQSELDAGAVEIDVAKSTIGGDETNRVYITGLDRPRYTSLPLAIQSSGPPFPVETRLLGVIAPTTQPSVSGDVSVTAAIDVTDEFENAIDGVPQGWTLVPTFDSGGVLRRVTHQPSGGVSGGRLKFEMSSSGTAAYAYRDFGIGQSASVRVEFDYRLDQRFADAFPTEDLWLPKQYQFFIVYLMCDSSGNGARVSFEATEPPATSAATGRTGSSWDSAGSAIGAVSTSDLSPLGSYVHVTLTGTKQSGGTYNWRLLVELGSTPIIDATLTGLPAAGGYCGLSIPHGISGHGTQISSVDNFRVVASAPPSDTSDDVATSYVYTFVNDIGEESAPSPASATIIRDEGTAVTVTTATAPPSGLDWRVETKRIYRSVTTAGVTTFLFVAEIPLAQADYVDTLTDEQLGEELESDDWDLPPENLRGILALPNDVYAGFAGNQLCFSVQGRPHAWPVRFRLNTDFPIVAIGNVDTTVIAATEKFPYLATGNAPDAYSMTKLELPQACVSKRGCVYLRGWGWCYPSPDGLVAVAGTGQARIITEQLFSRRDWQAINPSTLIAREHDDRLFAFYVKEDGTKEGMLIEAKEQGFGKVTLAFHATAMHVDPVTDKLYLVLDANNPPTTHGTPGTNQVNPDGATIYAWDSYEGGSPSLTPLLPYYWKGMLHQLPRETSLRVAAIDALDFDDLTFVFIADELTRHTEQVTDAREFLLPPFDALNVEFALSGTSRVTSLDVAEDVDELAQ